MAECFERLREAIRLRGITQAELCERTGIPKSAMSQYISGKFKPKQTRIYLISKALDINEAWLMGFDVPMDRRPEGVAGHGYMAMINEEALHSVSEPSNVYSVKLSAHEKDVIDAYINQPEMQSAVDKLLGVEENKPETVTIIRAARSKGDEIPVGESEIPKEIMDKLEASSEKCPF